MTTTVAALVAGAVAAAHAGGVDALPVATPALARSTLVPVLAGCAVLGLAIVLARRLVVRRALVRRVRFLMLPADTFDPPSEAVELFASGLARSRRAVRGLLDAPASAVRVELDTDADGRLRYVVEVPEHARQALRTAASAYGAVELRELDDADGAAAADRLAADEASTARVELVMARPSVEPLRAAGLDPDPLAAFARALGELRREQGEAGVICVDLLPLTPGARRRMRRRLLRRATREHRDEARPSPLAAVLGQERDRGRAAPAELVARRAGQHALTSKLGSPEPLFLMQVLIRVRSCEPVRAQLLVGGVLAAFDAWSGTNYLRASGLRLPGGAAFFGADAPWRRRRFDRRVATGLFRPARRRLVTATEVAALLKPPTVRCEQTNVLRSGGVVPPPPPGLPTFTGQPYLLPIGRVRNETGERIVGVPLDGTYFGYVAGRSRFGKTETGIGQALHLARAGHGVLFLDPHEDGIERMKAYLTDAGVRDRVVELNLAHGHDRQLGWNLFAVAGRSPDRARGQVDAVVDAFASALRWDEVNARALNLTTQAAQALVELAHQLPAELAPTIFQVATLLGDDDWRAAVLPRLSEATRQFFTDRFPRLSTEAITPVTNLIDRLRAAPAVAALLGSPTSTYDIRGAMDSGRIVLACPGDGSARDRLIANFIVFDVLHSAKSRASTPPDRRRPFYVFLDEVQTYDGASNGTLAALLEQTAKYGVRAVLLNQNPERLSAATLNAITTNRSHLLTTALNAKAAALLTREWAGVVAPEVVTQLSRYSFVGSVTLRGEPSPPFRIGGVSVEELFPEGAASTAEVAQLNTAIDRSGDHRPIADTLAELDGHDRRILDHLRRPRAAASSASGRTTAAHGRHTIDTRGREG